MQTFNGIRCIDESPDLGRVSTKCIGAIPEVVIDGVSGILVEKQNPKQIADAMIKLIENPGLRKKMGTASRKRFKRYYTMDQDINMII